MKSKFETLISRSVIAIASVFSISWSGVTTISDNFCYGPNSAVSDTGKAAVIWMNNFNLEVSIQACFFDGLYWFAYETISLTGDNVNPSIGLDDSGNAVALWECIVDDERTIAFSTKAEDGEWQVPGSLSSSNINASNALAMNKDGQTIAGWINQDDDVIELRTSILGIDWTPLQQIGDEGGNKSNLIIKINQSGNAIAVWIKNDTGEIFSSHTTEGFGTSWSTPTVISDGGSNSNLDLALNNEGDAIAVWVDNDEFKIFSAQYSAGNWVPASLLCDDFSYYPVCAALDEGFFASWLNLSTGIIETSRYVSSAWDPIQTISDEGPNDVPSLSAAAGNSSTIWTNLIDGDVKYVSYAIAGSPSAPETITAGGLNLISKITCSPALKLAAWMNLTDSDQMIQVNVE